MQKHYYSIGVKVDGTFLTPIRTSDSPWGYECRCDCGKTTFARPYSLKSKTKKSCGCGIAIRAALCYTDDEVKVVLQQRSKKMPSGCIEWQGAIQRGGYGNLRMRNKTTLVHRASWIVNKGEIPDGLCVLHRCDNRPCVNPDHLFLGTYADNNADCISKGRAKRSDRKGENHHGAILGSKDILKIRKLYAGGKNKNELSKLFGVHSTTIHDIVIRRRWKHI